MPFHLVTDHYPGEHPSAMVTAELEAQMRRDVRCRPVQAAPRLLWRLASAMLDSRPLHRLVWDRLPRDVAGFTVLMGPQRNRLLPGFLATRRRVVYLFDAWPSYHRRILAMARDWSLDVVFTSAREASAELDRQDGRRGRFRWLPEAVDPDLYASPPWHERTVDVLNFGRRWHALDGCRQALMAAGFSWRCEQAPGACIFPDAGSFRSGLAQAKISICVPLADTDPKRAGGIETLTARYLQSIAAGCVLYGRAPAELVDLFGFDPVIKPDPSDPVGQLKALLADAVGAERHTRRNREAMLAGHTWKHRWDVIARELA